jgi:CRP-like cAMP-binding protein
MSLLTQILKNTESFSSFADWELALLVGHCEELKIPKGTVIFVEDKKDDDAIYFVQEGVIKIIKGEESQRRILAMFGMGNFFGEISFLDSGPRSATAVADEDSIVYKLVPEKLDEIEKQAPQVYKKALKILVSKMARRLRETDEAVISANNWSKIIIT